jgi:hypothetical protein
MLAMVAMVLDLGDHVVVIVDEIIRLERPRLSVSKKISHLFVWSVRVQCGSRIKSRAVVRHGQSRDDRRTFLVFALYYVYRFVGFGSKKAVLL